MTDKALLELADILDGEQKRLRSGCADEMDFKIADTLSIIVDEIRCRALAQEPKL